MNLTPHTSMEKEGFSKNVQSVIGWLLIAGAIERIPGLARLSTFEGMDLLGQQREIPKIASVVFLFSLAGIQLVRLKPDGFGWAGLALLLSGLADVGPLSWLVGQFIYLGPWSGLVNAVLDLGLLTLLGWAHLLAAPSAGSKLIKPSWAVVLLAGAGVIGVQGRGMRDFEWGRGEAAKASEVPMAPDWSKDFPAMGPVPYRFEKVISKGISIVVFAGEAKLAEVESFAAKYDCKKLDMSNRRSWPNLAKAWKLPSGSFPQFFDPDDYCFSGRIPKDSRASVTIYFRAKDNKFLVQSLQKPRLPALPGPAKVEPQKSLGTKTNVNGQTQ